MMKPKETPQLEGKLQEAGKPYQKPFEQRQLPELPQPATWQDVLQRALLANGDLEASYHEWRAAMERISMSSYWPNSNVTLGFDYMFTKESMKTWDRVTGSAGFDQAMPLKLPNKVAKGGQVAYSNALQSAEQFRSTKFRVQRQVLLAYYDLALMEEQIRIEQQNLELLNMIHENARSRVQAGGAQQDLLKSQVALRTRENAVSNMQAQAATMRAMLNGMMNRPAGAPLTLPAELPAARPVVASDDQLIAMGVDASPEVARLAAQVKGRKDAIDLAKMQFLPDISPTAAFTGSVSQSLGAMVTLPTTIPMINASIREAKAMRDSSEAMLRQTRSDRAGLYVGTLYSMRNSARQEIFFNEKILPAAKQVLASSRQDYVSGKVGLIELVDAQRTLLEVKQSLAQFRIDREKRLAELEEIAGVDVEVLAKPVSPATRPTTTTAAQLSQR
jgi:outer membrane protein, heavy metal efflux system